MKNSILLICFLSCFSFLLRGNAADLVRYEDSINHIIRCLPDATARLKYLNEMVLRHQCFPLDSIFARRLCERARISGNDQYLCLGTYYLAGCYDRRHMPDTLEVLVGRLKEMAEKNGFYDYYLEQKGALSRAYASRRQVEKAIHIAKEGLEESARWKSNNGKLAACNALACAYAVSNRTETGLEYLLDAYKLFSDSSKAFLKVDILSRIASAYHWQEQEERGLPYLLEMDSLLGAELKKPETRNNWINLAIDCEIKQVLYDFENGNLDGAKMHLDKARALYVPKSTDPVFWLNIQLVSLQYYGKMQEDESAIALIDEVTPLVLKNYAATFPQLIRYKASLQKKHNIDDAIETIQYLSRTQDSLNMAFSISQLNQIKEIYHLDELLLEKEKIKNSNYKTGLLVLSVLTGLILLFWMYIRFISRKIAVIEKDISVAAEQTEAENQAKEILRKGISYDIRNPLNAVIGFAGLLAQSDEALDRESRVTYCQIIQKSAFELLEYVNHILELSRLESAKIQYEDQECDVIGICREVMALSANTEDNLVDASLETALVEFPLSADARKLTTVLKSMIIYLKKENVSSRYHTVIRLKFNSEKFQLEFEIVGSPLASGDDDKTILIRNEINAHFARHYKGSYKVVPGQGSKPGIILFVLPAGWQMKKKRKGTLLCGFPVFI